jgi:hypothetical protein
MMRPIGTNSDKTLEIDLPKNDVFEIVMKFTVPTEVLPEAFEWRFL